MGVMLFSLATLGQEKGMALIKSGRYVPSWGDSAVIKVDAFYLDVYPVTNREYIDFLKDNPKYRKSQILKLYVDEYYLAHFRDDLNLKPGIGMNEAVTFVSWYAAKEYCRCQGKRLPTMDEWEYAAMADETMADARQKKEFNQYLLNWYEKAKSDKKIVGSTFKNYWGVYDLHGLVWEWTSDFNTVLLSQDTRNGKDGNNNLFCGGGSYSSNDLRDYAAFMRYAFRSSLKANYSIKNLGFRCAKSIK